MHQILSSVNKYAENACIEEHVLLVSHKDTMETSRKFQYTALLVYLPVVRDADDIWVRTQMYLLAPKRGEDEDILRRSDHEIAPLITRPLYFKLRFKLNMLSDQRHQRMEVQSNKILIDPGCV